MRHPSLIVLIALAAASAMPPPAARALDDLSKYPDLKGQWQRIGPNRWESRENKAPLTPEYRAVYQDNLDRMEAGGVGDMASWYCLPQGMPMMMSLYDPMEVVVTPQVTYVLISHVNDSYRRIYTDGRDWPAEGEYERTFAGYSIGRWLDENGDGRYNVLEVETRDFKGPRVYDGTGLPLHHDNQTIVKERIHLDKSDPNILYNDLTVIDNALTRPWSITKKAGRVPNPRPMWQTAVCAENNSMVRIGKHAYYMSQEGYLMPLKKDQPPPDLRFFKPSPK
ncbi:MAG TPA: hypothetical protein VGL31_05435 [Xanthobacteraceae bacterium]|jgi:hypothetical protein